MAKADAKHRDEEAMRARAELDAAIQATKIGGDSGTKFKAVASQEEETGIPANEVARLRNLETENEALKKLLTEAYLEISSLKSSFGVKS
jgi:hypothetical protein